MGVHESQLPVIGSGEVVHSRHIEDVFQKLQRTGFKYLSLKISQVDDETPDDELVEAYRDQLDELMNEDSYEHIEVISLKNYSTNTGAYVYKPLRNGFETRLITHGRCSIFVKIDQQVFEFQCQQGDMIRLPGSLCYWIEVGVHACRYIHLYMTEEAWDKPSDRQDIQPCTLPSALKQAG